MSTGPRFRRNLEIVEIERTSSWSEPTVGSPSPALPRGPRRHDPSVAPLLVLSVVFFIAGVAIPSIGPWFAGVVTVVAALSVDTRHERELRDARRSRELP
jgi:hypothetical protein